MNKRKAPCKCPPRYGQMCKHVKTTDCRDVPDIIEALTYENEIRKKGKKSKPPKFRTKPFKPRHYKDTCVPMVPSMHTRLRYIGHCAIEPPISSDERSRKVYGKYDFDSTSDEETTSGILRGRKKKKDKFKKRVTYFDMLPGDIMLPTPVPIIKHSPSDKSILNVPSPKISGEIVQARRASVKPIDLVPPLPPKAAEKLYGPHSGIVINRESDFAPDVVHIPGSKIIGKKDKKRPCHKGGVCYRKTCNRKKCRRYAAMRKRRMARRMRSTESEVQFSTFGATDGTPRARGRQKHIKDEDDVCGLDEIPKPEHVQIPAHLKHGMLQTHSLTVLPCTKERKPDVHYGILTGSCNMYDSKFGGRSRGRQALTMSVMAYCLAFHYHPKQWTMKLVDNLIDAGDQWYVQCLDKVHDHSAVQGICEVLPFGRKQTLVLNGKRMQVLLGEPDIVGYTMSLDPTVYNLCRGLKAFFKDNRAGVLMTRVLKVVIWKDRICFYIFDPAGRDSRAYSNFTTGRAALINVKDVNSVADIFLARTIVEDQKFVLAPVKVLKMIDEKADEDIESDRELTQAEKAMLGYRILNENYAIVNANMHLGDRCFEEAKYRQALTIAVAAMTYAKISPPNTWFTKTLDKILRLGNKLYVDCTHPKVMIDLSIDNIPNEITIGPYACEIIIYRERVKGQLFTTKECLFNIRTGLEEFFSHEYNSGILEFNNYAVAVWRQKDMFYMFDPYPRTNDGRRSVKIGRACCMMLLNSNTIAEVFTNNWDYLPATTQFYIHAFKVLKLKKKQPKTQIVCTLSDEDLPGAKKVKRTVLQMSQAKGDGKEIFHDVLPMEHIEERLPGPQADEEQMGDIISLVDSIQEDYLPPIPLRYKNMGPEPLEPKIVNLDSPTVSVTQVVPPWPKPRDKTNEPIEPDPDPEPTPPPTPPPLPPPEGGEEEEEEAAEEEEDEETIARKKEEEAKRKAEEEEARRKAEELPPPLPPPPPSPQGEPEVPLAPPVVPMADEIETVAPANVDRRILLTEDAKLRFKLRQLRKKFTQPLTEAQVEMTPSQELEQPSNFKPLPDKTQIVRGTTHGISDEKGLEVLPFSAIMAIVTSYKYSINTWTPGIVNFVVDTANKLYGKKKEKFQLAPVHIIPKIAIGHQAFHANIDVVGEGATWQLENILTNKFFLRNDRGMITTSNYSCAFFRRNGLYYLFDGSTCNAMGLRDAKGKGNACLLRFNYLHDLVSRILFNKDGKKEDQQFILSRIIVRRLLPEPRMKLPEDYDYETGKPKSKKSKPSIVEKKSDKKSSTVESPKKSLTAVGYQQMEGGYRIEGTTSLKDPKLPSSDVKSCHFVSLIAMLMATMHPIRTWDHVMVDTCIEKGLEIHEKATNLNVCEKRVIKNIILDGKFININIKKITVVNQNPEKKLEQYLNAVLSRLRFVLVRFPTCSMVICQTEGYYHLFDPYASAAPDEEPSKKDSETKVKETVPKQKANKVASWTLYRSMDALIHRLKKLIPACSVNNPEFYTFELTSVKTAPRHSAMNYRVSPLFKPDDNPNLPYLKRRKIRPTVDEKMYWLNIETVPWSRMNPVNDLGFERKTPRTLWKEWDIEFPGDLFSLWGTVHPMDTKFDPEHRGKQYLAINVVAIVMVEACDLSAWTSSFLDGIVECGDKYHKKCQAKLASKPNHEIALEDLDSKFDDMFPYSFTVKFENVIFGFVYNMLPDRFNLSKALIYFFEKNKLGILTSPTKNLAFGRYGASFFMFDCQSHGAPIFSPGQGAAYMLKCESLNRLIYCMTLTLNIRRHGQQFHLYNVNVTLTEKTK